MGQGPGRTLLCEDLHVAPRHVKRSAASPAVGRCKLKPQDATSDGPGWLSPTGQVVTRQGRRWGERGPRSPRAGWGLRQLPCKTAWRRLRKLTVQRSHDPAAPLTRIHPPNLKHVFAKTCAPLSSLQHHSQQPRRNDSRVPFGRGLDRGAWCVRTLDTAQPREKAKPCHLRQRGRALRISC